MLVLDPHPLLDLHVLDITLPRPLGEISSAPRILAGMLLEADMPLASSDEVRLETRGKPIALS